jgi:hypothetical protein
VQINASLAARAHLAYIYTVTCNAVYGGTVGTGNFVWEPLATTIVQEPTCGDVGRQVIQWSYAVSAPTYAIASGHMGAWQPAPTPHAVFTACLAMDGRAARPTTHALRHEGESH